MERLFESKRNSAIQLSESGRSINIMTINSSKGIQVGGFIRHKVEYSASWLDKSKSFHIFYREKTVS